MNILNISTDKSLVGGPQLGDAVERHGKYGAYVDYLDIIVYTHRRDGLEGLKISDNVTSYASQSKSKLHFFVDAISLFKQISQRHRIDIVVCQDPFLLGLIGYYLKSKYKVKLQLNFHGDFWSNLNWLRERWLNIFFLLISKFIVPRADALRVMSTGQRDKLIKAGIKASKIHIIATPVNLAKYLDYQPLTKNKPTQKVILHVGRDDKVKDYSTLIKAFRFLADKYSQLVLYQVGADKYIKSAMLHLPAEVKNKIILEGQRPHDYLIELYHLADVVVLSSTSESFGKVLIEANACAKPVVSTATTGAQEIIQDGYNGFLVPVKNSQALAQQVIKLLDQSQLARQMGEHGRQLVQEKYGDNTQKIINLWQELLKK